MFIDLIVRPGRMAALVLCCAASAHAQTNPAPRAVPFTETFGSGVPSNFAGWNGLTGSSLTSQSAAEASAPTGDAPINMSAPGTSGGLYYDAAGGNIGHTYSSSGPNGANQWVFAINTTGQSNLTMSYDVTTVNVQGRPAQMVAQCRVGTSGAWTTLPAVAGNPYTSGALNDVVHVTMTLPSAVDGQSNVQIRFANWRGAGSGSSSRYTMDNLSVQGGGPIDPNLGACCMVSGECVLRLAAACATEGGAFNGAGVLCGAVSCPQPTGSCCQSGGFCDAMVTQAQCAAAGGSNFIANGACSPVNPCLPPQPVAVQAGDIAFGANSADAAKTLFQIRGVGIPTPAIVGQWTQNGYIEFVRFDNSGGVNHNAHGNLLGLNFGNSGGAGPLYSYATDGSTNFQSLIDQGSFNAVLGITNPRVGGLSVSPANNRIAVVGYDAAVVGVFSYDQGAAPGTGGGASVSGAAATTSIPYLTTPKGTYGTAWLDNDTLMVFVRTGGQNIKLFTVSVSGSGSGITFGAPQERYTAVDPGADAGIFASVAYNPQLSGYIYALSGSFSAPTSTNTLYVIDPATWTLVRQINLSGSMNTARDIAIGGDRNLYLSQLVVAGAPAIDRLVLDADSSGTISEAEIGALSDNSSIDYFASSTIGASSFNGFDIALSTVAPPVGACCLPGNVCSAGQSAAACSSASGTYKGDNSVCTPDPCTPPPPTGACCLSNNTCSAGLTQALCQISGGTYKGDNSACTIGLCTPATGACCVNRVCSVVAGIAACGGVYQGDSTVCGQAGNPTTCCPANFNQTGGVSVQDIFDFLSAWFSNNIAADFNHSGAVSVQDIFDFLAAWFVGC